VRSKRARLLAVVTGLLVVLVSVGFALLKGGM
jgi:hypothetical protein